MAAKKKEEAAPAEEKPKKSKVPEFEFPEEPGNDWAPYRLSLRFRVKELEDDHVVEGLKAKAGDFVAIAYNADGTVNGHALLKPEELAEHYEPGV